MVVPHADAVRRHWYWRPGWGVGTRFYTWHITFEGQPAVDRLAKEYAKVLSEQPMLDIIPPQWLHLTMQGVGFVDQADQDQVEAIISAARTRCAELASMELTLGAPHVDPESIQIAVEPAEPVRQLRRAIRAAIADVWGAERVPEPAEPYTPHMSLAYINADGPAEPLVQMLATTPEITATAVIDSCQLIILNRDEGMYVWEPHATVLLGR